jgi:hypothetical protein
MKHKLEPSNVNVQSYIYVYKYIHIHIYLHMKIKTNCPSAYEASIEGTLQVCYTF